MRGLYPEVARFKYKNKMLKIDIPLRLKLITLTNFLCPKCELSGRAKQIYRYCERYDQNTPKKERVELELEYSEKSRCVVPTKIMSGGEIAFCVDCYIKKQKRVRVKKEYNQLYKLYAPPNPHYIELDRLLFEKTLLKHRFHKSEQKMEYSVFKETLKEIYEDLKQSKEYASRIKKKSEKIHLIIKPRITKEDLEKANEIALQKKFVNKI